MSLKPKRLDKEAITRAVRLLEKYDGADGRPSITLTLSSINNCPSLMFFYHGEGPNDKGRAEYYENGIYTGINGYDDVYPGPFAMGVEKLEELVDEQHHAARSSRTGELRG